MGVKRPPRRDVVARNALVEQWIFLPLWFLHKYQSHPVLKHINLDDARQDAYLGLINAAEQWDESAGVAFSTYATVAMLRAIQTDTRSHRGAVYVPPCAWSASAKPEHRVAAIRARECINVDFNGDNEPPDREHVPEPEEISDQERRRLNQSLATLTPMEREVIVAHYYHGRTLQEIALRHKKTRAWYSILKIRALRKLRLIMQNSPL